MYSVIRLYDINNKVTKKLKFSYEPILDSMFGSPLPRNPIILYDNPIQYIETYKSNIIYKCYQKDKQKSNHLKQKIRLHQIIKKGFIIPLKEYCNK